MTREDYGADWAAWLRELFDEHPSIRKPADLVRAAGTKDNGRPVIDASRVTSWLRGQRPSYDLAVAAAYAFGRPPREALAVAGYVALDEDAEAPVDQQQPPIRDVLDAIENDPDLLPEAKAHLKNQYGLLLRVQAAAAGADAPERAHLRAARRRGERPTQDG